MSDPERPRQGEVFTNPETGDRYIYDGPGWVPMIDDPAPNEGRAYDGTQWVPVADDTVAAAPLPSSYTEDLDSLDDVPF